MMLPFLRLFAKKIGTASSARPAAAMPADLHEVLPDHAAPVNGKASPSHADYDRQPLAVDEFDHYIAPVADTERFHVH